jgi:hypothetical protein
MGRRANIFKVRTIFFLFAVLFTLVHTLYRERVEQLETEVTKLGGENRELKSKADKLEAAMESKRGHAGDGKLLAELEERMEEGKRDLVNQIDELELEKRRLLQKIGITIDFASAHCSLYHR